MVFIFCLIFFIINSISSVYASSVINTVNPDTILSIFNFGLTGFVSDPKFILSIDEIDNTEFNNFVNSLEFNLFKCSNPKYFIGFDTKNSKDFIKGLASSDPDLTANLLSINPGLIKNVFQNFLNKDAYLMNMYSVLELMKIKHIEYLRSIEHNYEYQNKSILDYIGNNIIEKNFGLSFRILDFDFFAQRNSIFSYLLDFIKNNEVRKIENLYDGNNFNEVKNLDLLLMANLNILTIKFEFKLKNNLSFGFLNNLSTNIPYLILDTEFDPYSGFKANAGISLNLNLNNGLYIKYSFNDKFRLNSGILYTKKIYEDNKSVTEQSINKAFDASNFSLFTKGIFDWDLSKYNYTKWFLSRLTISDTIMLTRYNFDFNLGRMPYFSSDEIKANYNIIKNYLEIFLSRSFNL